jgi:hypothetical protein
MTMQGIGFMDEISVAELAALDHALTAELATIEPPTVDFRRLTIQMEAVYLKAHPAEALYPLRSKMHAAVSSVLGLERFTEPAPDRTRFLPHVSIGYINRDAEAGPIAAALGTLVARPVEVTFTKADILEYHRDHRMYEWITATPIAIGAKQKLRPMELLASAGLSRLGALMSGDVASLAAEVVPYMATAASAYGGAVLAKARDDAADATVGLGRRLLQRVFGTRAL